MNRLKYCHQSIIYPCCNFGGGHLLTPSKAFTTSARRLVENHQLEIIPEAKVKWYYATDVPISKPSWYNYTKTEEAKRFLPFSDYDSRRIESQYRKYYNSLKLDKSSDDKILDIVDVNEDRLFQVNVRNFDLSPVYWEGPTYEVRRGIWFDSNAVPLSSELTQIIEEGYKHKKPYLYDDEGKRIVEQGQSKELKAQIAHFNNELNEATDEFPEVGSQDVEDVIRLENSKAIMYLSAEVAVIFPQSMINSYQLPIIRRLGGSSVGLIKVERIKRGFHPDMNKSIFDNFPNKTIPDISDVLLTEAANLFSDNSSEPIKKSTNYSNENDGDNKKQNKEMKSMLEDDFEKDTSSTTSKRNVEHLVFCVHGIGQILGTRYESINFAHNINVMRNTMKNVYKENKKFRNLAYPEDDDSKDSSFNNKIQVFPISWRHKVDFHPNRVPAEELKKEEPRLPTLSQINVDGVKSLRNVIGDVALDILLYYESGYFTQILLSVTEELNRVYSLYKEKNPDFNGKVHILGHSLGSAIAFDIASRQFKEIPKNPDLKTDLLFDIESLFCVGCPVGVFKLLSQKNIVHRNNVPQDFDPRKSYNFVSPKCENLYNLYHPCDPIGYRLEPLIKPKFANFKAEEAPFAVDGFNTQIKGLASITDDIQEKLSQATGWFLKRSAKKLAKGSDVIEENALGDIVTSIVKSDPEEFPAKTRGPMKQEDLNILKEFNKGGRVDYCLPMGVFDISLVSAISAHVSYFEDQDTAGFVMGEILSLIKDPVESKMVSFKRND